MDDSPVKKIGRAYAEALLSGDEVAAEVAIREALAAKLSSSQIDEEVIAPAMWLIGELWQRRGISGAGGDTAPPNSIRGVAPPRGAARPLPEGRGHTGVVAAPPRAHPPLAL